MSSENSWALIISICQATNQRWCPGISGEPWVTYRTLATLIKANPETVEKLVGKHKIAKHPVFAGLIQISSFESVLRETPANEQPTEIPDRMADSVPPAQETAHVKPRRRPKN